MGLFNKFNLIKKKKTALQKRRRKSFFSFIKQSDVTEDSLEVWRHLPSQIRHDPSMVSFQMQEEKLHGEYIIYPV